MTNFKSKSALIRLAKDLLDSNDLAWMLRLPPWAKPQHKALRRLRKVARKKLRSEVIERFGWHRLITQTLAWPFISTLKAYLALKSHPVGCTEKLKQFLDYCWLQWAHNFRIEDQQALFLNCPRQRRQLLGYMQWRENQALINLTKEKHYGYPDIHEKQGFTRFCTEFQFPTPQPLAEGEDTQCRIISEWPKADLFFKPANLGWGKGVEVLKYHNADLSWRGPAGHTVTPTTIAAYAEQQMPGEPWVLQTRVTNAKSWNDFTAGGLPTVRVITGRAGQGAPPQLVTAYLRMPQEGAITDNLCSGGIGAPLDYHTGRLSPGKSSRHPSEEYTCHPSSKSAFVGQILPGYHEIISLALKGHEKAGEWTNLGWDITFTEEGPMMIETNLNWAVPPLTPVTDGPYLEVMQKALNIS